MSIQLSVNKKVSQKTTNLHISNIHLIQNSLLLNQDSDLMTANGLIQRMSMFTQLSFKRKLLLSGMLMTESGITQMALRQLDQDQLGSTQTVPEKITIKAPTKVLELSVMLTRSTLDGERMIQNIIQTFLETLELSIQFPQPKHILTTNSNQTLRSRSGKNQHFTSTHTSTHLLVPLTMLMAQEPLKMEEL